MKDLDKRSRHCSVLRPAIPARRSQKGHQCKHNRWRVFQIIRLFIDSFHICYISEEKKQSCLSGSAQCAGGLLHYGGDPLLTQPTCFLSASLPSSGIPCPRCPQSFRPPTHQNTLWKDVGQVASSLSDLLLSDPLHALVSLNGHRGGFIVPRTHFECICRHHGAMGPLSHILQSRALPHISPCDELVEDNKCCAKMDDNSSGRDNVLIVHEGLVSCSPWLTAEWNHDSGKRANQS